MLIPVSVSDCSLPAGFLPALRSCQTPDSKPRPSSGLNTGTQDLSSKPLHAMRRVIVAVTPVAAAILALELFRLCGFSFPNIGVALVAAIVYSSFAEGLQAGLIATGIAILYELLIFSGAHLFTYTWNDTIRLAVFSASALTSTILVGILRRRTEAVNYSRVRNWAEESLVAESAHLQGILHQLPLGVLVFDATSGEIAFANDKARSILGSDVNRIHSVGYPAICHAAGGRSYSPHEWPWRRCAQLCTAVEDEFLYSRADGRLVIIRARACPITDRAGRPVATVMSFSDVAEGWASRHAGCQSDRQMLEPAPC